MIALVSTSEDPYCAFRDIQDPKPLPNEALVTVSATSVNRGEVKALPLNSPGTQVGWDVAGTVSQAASDGSGPPKGTRVVGLIPGGGAWAERVAVPTRLMAVVPHHVPFEHAATLPVAGLTALCALEMGGFCVHKRVLVTGASGGVGRFAVQLASLAGAHVTAVSSSPERSAGLIDLGAHEILEHLPPTGEPYDIILDGVGGHTTGAAMQRIADFGTIIVYASSDERPISFPAASFRSHPGAVVRSLRIFDELQRTLHASRDLQRLVDLLADGRLLPQVSLTASWQEPEPVLRALLDRKITGKAVFRVN